VVEACTDDATWHRHQGGVEDLVESASQSLPTFAGDPYRGNDAQQHRQRIDVNRQRSHMELGDGWRGNVGKSRHTLEYSVENRYRHRTGIGWQPDSLSRPPTNSVPLQACVVDALGEFCGLGRQRSQT